MIEFQYTAKDKKSNEVVKGKISADSQMAAADILNSKDLYPIKITKGSKQSLFGGIRLLNKIKDKDLVLFTRQLATLVNAGLPINQALTTATNQVNDKNFTEILEKISASVEGGQTLADSFAQYPEIFSKVYTNLVHAGEQSGTLDDTLQRLAELQENQLKLSRKIRGALIYPVIVLVVIIIVLIYMLSTVMPQISNLYTELNKPLPLLTQLTIGFSGLVTTFWPITILLILATAIGIRAYFRTPNGIRNWHRLKLKLPVIGILFKKVYMARFSRTMSSLVNSGVPLLEALSISADSINNVILADIVKGASEDVRSGKSLSSALSKNEYFLKLVPQMIKVGEESGTLGEMLAKIATYYEEEVDQAVKNLSTVIEPILIVILGGMVFFIILAILYPIYSLVGEGITPPSTTPSSTSQPR
ncbi:MAG TPA: type II secretion system F family protein [Candidatus Saccharibacteria bacterium]|nr:type II secretion system F family protein [Candidatus Saccharibacteria bacterium]HMT39923.1 type II secretion system F family protein [Candidatus Saccharibacteria bacterium]